MDRMHTHGKRTILVIEDDIITREMLSEILSPSYHVLSAENGRVGLEVLRAHQNRVKLIILDLIMPEMNGYQFLEAKMADHALRSIPVIVTTSADSDEEQIKALEKGANDFVPKPFQYTILLHRVNALVRLFESLSTLQEVQSDPLTGVLNHVFFLRYAKECLLENPEEHYDMICTNIESFRMITARRGKKTGDGILRFIAKKLEEELTGDELIGRLHTDRFVLLMKHREPDRYLEMENRIREALKNSNKGPVVFKYGVYPCTDTSLPIDQMIDSASYALDSIQQQYGRYVAFYDENVRRKKEQEQDVIDHMELAIAENQFEVYYQPKRRVKLGTAGDAEALVRWRRSDEQMIPPDSFIPLFERNGFIAKLDYYVWEKVCQFLRRRMDAGLKVVPVSVNISRSDFDQENLDEAIIGLAEQYHIPHQYLHLEITESAYSDNPKRVKTVIQNLHDAGFKIELDDFGKGYSTLSVLSAMPLDAIKLDQSIVRGMENKKEYTILKSVIELANQLHMETIAEGCETAEQAAELQKLGCTYIQGYYYSKPIPEKEFTDYLEQNLMGDT